MSGKWKKKVGEKQMEVGKGGVAEEGRGYDLRKGENKGRE